MHPFMLTLGVLVAIAEFMVDKLRGQSHGFVYYFKDAFLVTVSVVLMKLLEKI